MHECFLVMFIIPVSYTNILFLHCWPRSAQYSEAMLLSVSVCVALSLGLSFGSLMFVAVCKSL